MFMASNTAAAADSLSDVRDHSFERLSLTTTEGCPDGNTTGSGTQMRLSQLSGRREHVPSAARRSEASAAVALVDATEERDTRKINRRRTDVISR
ncbi:hypothetical protein J6590_041753 [Homalodisca vitripennis]|nr:hypothetical protein J6590_041753 [Homalodisca vitripennis]